MRVKDHTIIDPLFGAVYTIPEEFAVGSDDFERCCGNIFREIISRKIHWHIPLTDLETFFDNTLDDDAANIDDILNDEEFLLYEQHCLELRRKQRLYTEELLQKAPESLTDEEAEFLRKKESMQVDFLLTGEYLESIRAWRKLTGCNDDVEDFFESESSVDTIEFSYSVQSRRGGLNRYEAQAGYMFCDDSYTSYYKKEQMLPYLDVDIFINGKHCSNNMLNWEDIAWMLKKSGRYKFFRSYDNPLYGEEHELDFFIFSKVKNNRLEWQLERAFCFDSGCNEEDQKLRYIFDYRQVCQAMLELTANILASDNLYNAAWYDLMQDVQVVFADVVLLDTEEDILFHKYCQDRWYIRQIYESLSEMAVQFAPENFPEIPPWRGEVPPRSTEHGFYDIIAAKTGAQPLHHTQPPRWLVGEEVFYPLENNVENDFPEIPEGFAEKVEIIKQAIDARQLVEMEYFSHKQEKTVRLFAPEIIVIYKMQWYVAGFCKLREERRTFCLDGIKKITLTNRTEPSHGIAGDVKENGLFNDL